MPPLLTDDAATHFYRCRRVPPLMPPPIFIGAAACPPPIFIGAARVQAASLSPAKREVKREAKKCGRGVQKNKNLPEVWLEVWLLGLQRIQGGSVSPRAEFCIRALAAFIVP